MASLAVVFDDDPDGIEAARRILARLEKAQETGASRAEAGDGGVSNRTNQAVLLYKSVGEGSFTRRILELLAGDTGEGLTPAEIATELQGAEKETISKGSARAAILNARRVEKRLRAEGRIEEQVIVADFGDYEIEGAGRYRLEADDRTALSTLAE